MVRSTQRAAVVLGSTALLAAAAGAPQPKHVDPVPPLRETILELSEPGAYFDTDNLISNERGYGRAVARLDPSGGAFIGVGPEQNFSYIARARPRWAFIVDIRRDNMLEHLLLNAILANAESPLAYLGLLFSRALPPGSRQESLPIAELVRRFAELQPSASLFERSHERLVSYIEDELAFPLSPADKKAIRQMHRAFFEHQLELRFQSHGRAMSARHPSYRDLLLEQTPEGVAASFLGSSDDYAFVRRLAREGRLVPVVGDLAGEHAIRAVGRFLRERGETVGTFYTSNVEFYLLGDGRYRSFVENVRSLPIAKESVFVRAYFDYGRPHPTSDGLERSTMVLQRIPRFLELDESNPYRSYWDVCARDFL